MSSPRRPVATYQMEKFEVFSCGHWSCLKFRLNAEDHGLRMSQAGSYRSVIKHANTLCEICTAAAQLREVLFTRSLPTPTLPQHVSPPSRQDSLEWEDQDQTITKPESVRCKSDSLASPQPLDGSTTQSTADRNVEVAATLAALEGRPKKSEARGCWQPFGAFFEKAQELSSQVLESVGDYWDAVKSIPEDLKSRREDMEHVQACLRHSRYIEEQGGNPSELFSRRIVVSTLGESVEVVGLGIALASSTAASPSVRSAIYPASPPVTLDLERDRGSLGFSLGWGALRCCNVPEVLPAIEGTEPGPRRRVVKPRAKDLRRRKTGPRTRMPRKVDGRLR
ncbi:hypothetical protein LTS10_001052 [Elasticomyces elasticus]|nr:hypothetical protein LTS10_001052 [Elasticomyces elasticus]